MLEKGIAMASYVHLWYSRKIHSFKNYLWTQNSVDQLQVQPPPASSVAHKPPASSVGHITRDLLTCYSCSYYSSIDAK